MEMSAQQLTQMLGSLLEHRAKTRTSNVAGARVAVTPGDSSDRYGRMAVLLPNGQTFLATIEEV